MEHYVGLLEWKKRSAFQSKPVRQTVKQELLDLVHRYLEEPDKNTVTLFSNDIYINQTNLAYRSIGQ